MKRKDLVTLYTVLNKLSDIQHTKFAYFVMKNIKIIKPEIEFIQDLNKVPSEFIEYDKKRIEMCKKYAVKDDEGQPIIEDGNYKIKNQKLFDKKLNELKKEYYDTIEEKNKKDLGMTKFLMEDADVDFYKIKMEDLPELSAKVLMVLDELIRD